MKPRDPQAEAIRADQWRDSLRDIKPVPTYVHRPLTGQQLRDVLLAGDFIHCGKQTTDEVSK